MKIGIVDYGSGNFKSVLNAIKLITENYKIINFPTDFHECSHIILPGVGTFNYAMEKIKQLHFLDSMNEEILINKKLYLGICVGMQILAEKGFEFGSYDGLGWIKGNVSKFNFFKNNNLILPHMGWNNIILYENNSLFKDLNKIDSTFYFAHGYHLNSDLDDAKFTYCNYGYDFIASVEYENIFGVQFHPEKSQRNGIQILKKFINLNG